MKPTTRILSILVLLTTTASADTSFHVTGVAIDHESRPVAGGNVRATLTYDSCSAQGACTPTVAGTWFQSTGSDGRFDIGVTFPAQPNAYAKNQKLVVDLFGSETSVFSKRTVAWNADPAFWTVDIVIRNAPANVSPDGGYWARKIGCGEYPVFVVEGFDPGDSMKTGDKADPTSWVGLLSASQLPNGGGGLLDYFTSHNYSVYLLSSGFNSANSIKADTSGDVTKGMAYQSVFLAKTILEQSHPGKPLVMGGYSAGGLYGTRGPDEVVRWQLRRRVGRFPRRGLFRRYDVVLRRCPPEGREGAADLAPALRPRRRGDRRSDRRRGRAADARCTGCARDVAAIDRSAAVQHELLDGFLGGSVDPFGCESTDYDFMDECTVHTNVHDDFMSWIGGYPTRAGGGRVPAIAFSLGTAWRDETGAIPKPAYCWDAAAGRGKKYFETKVQCYGNHNLYLDTAGGVNECTPGSVINSLLAFNGLSKRNAVLRQMGARGVLRANVHPDRLRARLG